MLFFPVLNYKTWKKAYKTATLIVFPVLRRSLASWEPYDNNDPRRYTTKRQQKKSQTERKDAVWKESRQSPPEVRATRALNSLASATTALQAERKEENTAALKRIPAG